MYSGSLLVIGWAERGGCDAVVIFCWGCATLALPSEISMKYAYITIIANKHFGKVEKKTFQTNIAVDGLYDTRLYGSNTVWCHTDHLSQ